MEKQWKMTAADFYALLKAQGYTCGLSGDPLTPETTCIARKTPLEQGGKHDLSNVYLIHRSIYPLAKYSSQDDILRICKTIIQKQPRAKKAIGKLSKSQWALSHDRIITFNKTGNSAKVNKERPETWAQAALHCVSMLKRTGNTGDA